VDVLFYFIYFCIWLTTSKSIQSDLVLSFILSFLPSECLLLLYLGFFLFPLSFLFLREKQTRSDEEGTTQRHNQKTPTHNVPHRFPCVSKMELFVEKQEGSEGGKINLPPWWVG
jgi:hypothetical protein